MRRFAGAIIKYLDSNLTPREARDLIEPGKKTGFFNRDPELVRDNRLISQQNAQIKRNNKAVDKRQATRAKRGMTVDTAQQSNSMNWLLDREQDLKTPVAMAASLGGLGVAGAAGLYGYHQNEKERMSTGPLSVGGRVVANAIAPYESGSEGYRSAQGQLLANQQMRAQKDLQFQQNVMQLIDRRTDELQGRPIQRSDGSVQPMDYDTASRLATEQVAMELRANDIL